MIGANLFSSIRADGAHHEILGNLIGTNESGADFGTGFAGIIVFGNSMQIGDVGAGNVIAFHANGIDVQLTSGLNVIQGNFIGTDPDGNALGGSHGISVSGDLNLIGGEVGGLDSGAGNVIGHQTNGIRLQSTSTQTSIHGELHRHQCRRPRPRQPFPGRSHLLVERECRRCPPPRRIPGRSPHGRISSPIRGPARRRLSLSKATEAVTRFAETNSMGTRPLRSTWPDDGSTPNDVGDSDTGDNQLQNFPEFDVALTSYNEVSGDLEVRYRIRSDVGDAVYPIAVDFFLRTTPDGQADVYVGSDVYTDVYASSFRAVAIEPQPGVFVVGDLVATATDADGNTSELSTQLVPVPEPAIPLSLCAGAVAVCRVPSTSSADVMRGPLTVRSSRSAHRVVLLRHNSITQPI